MRISDLSRQTSVPVATIKFYLRERLLPPGRRTGRNQAEYSGEHLRRLTLIRAFTTIGHLDLSSVRTLLAAIEDRDLPLPALYEVVNRVLFAEEPTTTSRPERTDQARTDVDGFIDRIGWHVEPEAPGKEELALILSTLQQLGCDCGVDFFLPYADAAERLAVQELDLLPPDGVGDRAAAVVRTVLLEAALAAIRRMARDHHVTLRYSRSEQPPPEAEPTAATRIPRPRNGRAEALRVGHRHPAGLPGPSGPR
ncbi:MerR family transcriptional regulator [Micromonospora globispora]|uniref:MerR family transcriptional regulator n=1 Tax=Micromonospora globispora TaxID=1450148 RepID=A0A317KFY8_9ACTN|nr:MerR family transcriptional regulator [Micromonospora globispora]PWU52121.1 MerR family transcriptional regulator [Micromonospora globispora]